MTANMMKALASAIAVCMIAGVSSCAPAEQTRPVPGTKIAPDDASRRAPQPNPGEAAPAPIAPAPGTIAPAPAPMAPPPATKPMRPPAPTPRKISAKNIYYDPGDGGPSVPPAQQQAAVRFWIELIPREGREPQTVTPEYVFYTGDRTRYRVATNQNSFVYVATEGPMGDRNLLFPSLQAGMDNRVQRHVDFVMPTTKGFFTFMDPAGPERVVIIVSPTRIPEMDQIAQARSAAKSIQLEPNENRSFTRFIEKQEGKKSDGVKSRNIVYEPVAEGPQPGGYYAQEQPGFAEPVVIKITLQHKPAEERR
ncbi:MAG: DUF4384 domain-containing protein [Candidatus Sumerlaeota bacterium]|nr:DUF4384 domain-containing protein [Candidatus Sumerlaeota bacterium]